MSKEKIEIGDYVKYGRLYGKVINIDNDDDFVVIDEDSDQDYWNPKDVYFVEPEEVGGKFIFMQDISQDYHGIIRLEDRVIKVGCQIIPYETIATIYNHIKHALPV